MSVKNLKKLEIKEKWDTATKLGVCFKCLKKSHLAKECKNNKKWGIESCQLEHHELLHRNKNNLEKANVDKTNLESDSNITNKCSLHTQTLIKKKSMRTVTVLVKKNEKEIELNAILDDGSDQSYIDAHVAEYLGYDNSQKLETRQIEFDIVNQTNKKSFKMSACTTNDVVGDLKVIKWNEFKSKFSHISKISFSKPVNGGKIDLLIGLDHPYLHAALEEVIGKNSQTPLDLCWKNI